ncbi:MAG: hypothetical protein ACON38_12905 [Akkermansiaceae bacterium]
MDVAQRQKAAVIHIHNTNATLGFDGIHGAEAYHLPDVHGAAVDFNNSGIVGGHSDPQVSGGCEFAAFINDELASDIFTVGSDHRPSC